MNKPFPLRVISEARAIRDYMELRESNTEHMDMRHVGNKATDYFFESCRIKVPVAMDSQLVSWNDPEQAVKIKDYGLRLYKKPIEQITPAQWRAVLNLCRGAVCQFKPNIARFLYSQIKPQVAILDSCAGWGGRCLGAMSLDIDYIGIDINEELNENYLKMIDLYPSNSNVQFITSDCLTIDYSQYDYDCFFTSPPYSNIEKYKGMPIYEDFKGEFITPLIRNTYLNLKPGGYYCLNIPVFILEWVTELLGDYHLAYPLKKAQRSHNGRDYAEYIYIWKKED
tara:strand:- start:2603 stop:3448 length:846 start_codon:yes stop_codon:yes gene_type:complete